MEDIPSHYISFFFRLFVPRGSVHVRSGGGERSVSSLQDTERSQEGKHSPRHDSALISRSLTGMLPHPRILLQPEGPQIPSNYWVSECATKSPSAIEKVSRQNLK